MMNGEVRSVTQVTLDGVDAASKEIFTITKPPVAPLSLKATRNYPSSGFHLRSLLPAGVIPVVAEFVSTGLLIFLGCMSCTSFAAGGSPQGSPSLMQIVVAFGFVVMFNIQIFGHVSGAHMNPSVTLAAVLLKRMSPLLGMCYAMAQCVGAIAGYGLLLLVLPNSYADGHKLCVTEVHGNVTPIQGVVIEIFLTSILILLTCVFWDPVTKDNVDSFSIKFGFTITGLSLAGGPFTGASMNPARSLGPAIWTNAWEHHWVYWVGPLTSAVIAAFFYKFLLHSQPAPVAGDPAEELPLSTHEKVAGGAA